MQSILQDNPILSESIVMILPPSIRCHRQAIWGCFDGKINAKMQSSPEPENDGPCRLLVRPTALVHVPEVDVAVAQRVPPRIHHLLVEAQNAFARNVLRGRR
jgi:hypothetical protein